MALTFVLFKLSRNNLYVLLCHKGWTELSPYLYSAVTLSLHKPGVQMEINLNASNCVAANNV